MPSRGGKQGIVAPVSAGQREPAQLRVVTLDLHVKIVFQRDLEAILQRQLPNFVRVRLRPGRHGGAGHD